MNSPFNISQEKLKELMSGYAAWIKSDPKEEKYPQTYRELSKKIKSEFLSVDVLSTMSDNDLYDKIFKYSRKLEGPVQIKLGEPRLRGSLAELRRNMLYIMTSVDTPFIIAQNILEGKYRIDNFAKAFWSPILLAQFPDVLPNWNNKTEKFLRKFGINISTRRLSIEKKYKMLSEAFTILSELSGGGDFYSINHLMHYGTVIPEGISLINQLQGNEVTDPVKAMINEYKDQIKKTRLKDELFKWELVKKYLGRPDLNAPDFSAEIKSIDFSILAYKMAIAVKNHIVTKFAEEYRTCLVKLFDEDEDLNNRIKNFVADVIIVYKKSEGKHVHHHDERTISTYLTYHNPDKYTFFKDAYYQKYCKMIGIEPKPKGEKYPHYLALISDLRDNYILPDSELISLVKGCMNSDCFADNNHLIMAQDILYQAFDKDNDESEDEEITIEEIIEEKMENNNIGLNRILYGPPGTGKTYGTIDESLKILGVELTGLERENMRNKFAEFQKAQRVYFTTFHQNMAYEDFIEGIKPLEPDDDDEFLKYEVQDGLFMKACVEATFNYIQSNFRQENVVEKLRDFNMLFDKLYDQVSNAGSEKIKTKSGGQVTAATTSQGNFSIKHEGSEKPYTVSRDRLSRIYELYPHPDEIKNVQEAFRLAIGGCNSTAYWSILNAIAVIRDKEAKGKVTDTIVTMELLYKDKRKIVQNYWDKKDSTVLSQDRSEPYVFIIDEINRGNVAQIFGELITLIEEDKRMGKKETLYAGLPYSKHSFAVPPNLYIIGTMNTADRSVEALDAALRRRFSFIHKMPEEAILKTTSDGIELSKLLFSINNRLKVLKDIDHTIGHAWLWNVNDVESLREVFGAKILPLLQEYFYHDYEKLGLVLGDAFFKEKVHVSANMFAKFSGGSGLENQYDQSWIFELKSPLKLTIEDFQSLYI